QGRPPNTMDANATAIPTPAPRTYGDRPRRCMWCDSLEHERRECVEFAEALRSKRVSLGEKGRVIFNGQELPLMFGKGGMKRFLVLAATASTATTVCPASTTSPITVGANNIPLESYGSLGSDSSVMVTTLDFET